MFVQLLLLAIKWIYRGKFERSGAIAFSDLLPFLLIILVQNFMLIKNKSHTEKWVWKSTETKLFTFIHIQSSQKSWKVIMKKCDLNTTTPSPCWIINKLQIRISRITPSRMKVKYKSNHEETRLKHHHSLAMLKNRRRKIFEMSMTFVFTRY